MSEITNSTPVQGLSDFLEWWGAAGDTRRREWAIESFKAKRETITALEAQIKRLTENQERCTGDASACSACRDTRPYIAGLNLAIQRILEST